MALTIKITNMKTDANETIARNWWSNELSINEQKEFANKHLLNFEVSALIGSTAKYATLKYWNKLITKVWEAEVNNTK